IDVVLVGAGQAADDRAVGRADLPRYGVHRFPVARRRRRETSLDDIDTQTRQLRRHVQLLTLGHRAAGSLLAVAQGSVEDQYFVGHAVLLGCRWPERYVMRDT